MMCPACHAGCLHKGAKQQTYTYKGKSITLEQTGMWCDQCDEGILDHKDIERTENEFQAFKDKIDHVLTPEEIHHIRKALLGLTQAEASKIFGGGVNAFGRYERGESKPMLAVVNLLKMFERHPNDLEYFRQ